MKIRSRVVGLITAAAVAAVTLVPAQQAHAADGVGTTARKIVGVTKWPN
jgi:hypothetical protein